MSEPRVSEAEPQTEQEFEGMEVDAPRVGHRDGLQEPTWTRWTRPRRSSSERDIGHEVRVMSAHRDPDVVADYAKNAKMRGLRVIIAGAGLSAALPGVVAAHTDAAGDRRAADLVEVGRGRAGRAALDRPDAAGRAGRLRSGVDNAKNAAVLAARILDA